MKWTYIYLSWAGWIWFLIAGSYVAYRLWAYRLWPKSAPNSHADKAQPGFDVIVPPDSKQDQHGGKTVHEQ